MIIAADAEWTKEKRCPKCKIIKLLYDFPKSRCRANGVGSWCKVCKRVYNREFYTRNKEAIIKRTKDYRASNKDKVADFHKTPKRRATKRAWTLKKKYGLSMQDYNTILAQQGGVCSICGEAETAKDVAGNLKPMSVDHSHVTGVVRTLLCDRCNKLVGALEKNPARTAQILEYINTWSGQ